MREAVRRRLRGVPPDSVEASMPIRPSDDATYSESGFNKVSLNDMYMLSLWCEGAVAGSCGEVRE